MREFVVKLFTSDLMPHGYCYLWKPEIVWLHAVSDGLIALAYYLIPTTLVYFVRKASRFTLSLDVSNVWDIHLRLRDDPLVEVWTLWHGTTGWAAPSRRLQRQPHWQRRGFWWC